MAHKQYLSVLPTPTHLIEMAQAYCDFWGVPSLFQHLPFI